jgi:hypothetical protein
MLYTFAGTSILKGQLKVRFANSEARARQLSKLGDTDVNIVALPSASDKASAVRYLLDSGFAKTDAVKAALEAELSPVSKPNREVKIRVKVARPAKAARKPAKAVAKPAQAKVEVTEAEVDRLYAAVYGQE